jgi:nucleoside-diphosphate-sugar epimerase
LFPGNVWNFGSGMPPVLDETTPMHPTARKGEMRVEMEQRIQEACDRGMRAIILRAGDFYGSGRGSWFDLVVVKDIKRNNLTYPGPYDAVHEWAYLPDYVATLVKLTAIRNDLPPCVTFGFPGHAMTGHELIAAIEAVTGGKFNAKQMNWWMIKTVGRLLTLGRELAEIEYLWRVPHRISGDKLRTVIRDVPHTPINDAIRTSLIELGHKV